MPGAASSLEPRSLQIAAEFVTSAAGAGDFPRDRLPEVALVGRSNVGKSSLINALVRRTVARTSAAPGKTRLANFYRVQRGSAPALLSGRPARAMATRAGGDAVGARSSTRLTDAVFRPRRPSGERTLAVLLLVDARHPGLESDLDAWEWLQSQPCPRGHRGNQGRQADARRTRASCS